MKNYLENGLSDGSIKSSTYRKYITILNNLRKITIDIEGKDYLPFRNFNNINFIREITLGLKNNHNVIIFFSS